MEPNFQTSFIPKKPIVAERAKTVRSIGFFTIISILILFAVLVGAGALYFYKGVVKTNITKMEDNLILARSRFEPSKLTELQVLDKRLRASSEILANHIAITPVFEALSLITMKTVRFTKFSYALSDDKDAKVNIKMSGIAVGYRSVALQSDLFAKNKNLIQPVFSNLTLDNSGNVLFDLDFSVDSAFVNYKQMLLTQS